MVKRPSLRAVVPQRVPITDIAAYVGTPASPVTVPATTLLSCAGAERTHGANDSTMASEMARDTRWQHRAARPGAHCTAAGEFGALSWGKEGNTRKGKRKVRHTFHAK